MSVLWFPRSSLRTRALTAAVLPATVSLLLTDSLCAIPPDCPYCDTNAFSSDVPAGTPLLGVSMKWCGISEAPSVADPSLYCAPNFKTMLWRRHERASDCIWIDQCRITCRSGGAVQSSDYKMFNDLDTMNGDPGDVVIAPSCEMIDTWEECDDQWQDQPKGIIAVSVFKLIAEDGTSLARGVAIEGAITYPWLAVADPDVFCQLNERSLAHEVGHVLSLSHTTTNGNLMQTGGSGADLTSGQCTDARDYINDHPILDPPPGPLSGDPLDFALDVTGDVGGDDGYLDIYKTLVMDRSVSAGQVDFFIGTRGLIPRTAYGSTTYWFALDVDNMPTGNNASVLVPDLDFPGVDQIIEVLIDVAGDAVATLWEDDKMGGFTPVKPRPGQINAQLNTAVLNVCDATPDYVGPDEVPLFAEIEVNVSSNLISGGFAAGLGVQTASDTMGLLEDLGPDLPEVLDFPEIVFPGITVPGEVAQSCDLSIAVVGMPPAEDLAVFLGPDAIDPMTQTDGTGFASFTVTVPQSKALGTTLLTVGVTDPNNAITADTVIDILPPPLADVNGDCLVNVTDLLSLLAAWGPCPGCAQDLDGDGFVGVVDLLILLGDWT